MIDILRTLIICVSLHPISNQQKIDMQKNLVIVESPAKAKTIEKFLGKDYKVMSSYGHIRDLKTKDFSIDLEHNYAPEYVIPSDKKKLVTELKNEAKKAEQVWLASDEDREGEAISWHLYEVLGLKPENTKRIVFHEITKNAILHAIETPRDIIDRERSVLARFKECLHRFLIFHTTVQLRREDCRTIRQDTASDHTVGGLRDKLVDLSLPLYDQTYGNRLHAPRG